MRVGVVVQPALFVRMRVSVDGPVGVSVGVLVLDRTLLVGVTWVFLVAGRGV
ncbi:hypothetical protein MTER_20680 [Mycolicibacter terrae]|uniref:Uncharacterized protein n=1 Tax=Mycolicibacter terrae TaxID=1788 RepID=A0AAD1HW56_9MYCO|nr:hypothetical protein MTER_20680 [Mycolicibacter terrae]SNV73163.1 Uncharacterised protein [Mycolicibacter terrae]